jgi:uncharacterized protein with GYD domain
MKRGAKNKWGIDIAFFYVIKNHAFLLAFSLEGRQMATFVMMGKYTPQALADLSPKRTDNAVALIKKHKGELLSMYAALGQNDIVLILELPGVKEAMKVSIALTKMTGIGFNTSPAVPVDAFDKLTVGL